MQTEITDEKFKKQIVFLLNNSWTGKGDMYFPLQNSVNIEKDIFLNSEILNTFSIKRTRLTQRELFYLCFWINMEIIHL